MYIYILLKYMFMAKRYISIGIVILMSLLAVSTHTLFNRNQDFVRGCLAIDVGMELRYVLMRVLMN